MALTATCFSLKTLLSYKQTITLFSECTHPQEPQREHQPLLLTASSCLLSLENLHFLFFTVHIPKILWGEKKNEAQSSVTVKQNITRNMTEQYKE